MEENLPSREDQKPIPPILPDPELLTAHDRMTWVNEVRARLVAKEAVSEEEIRHAIKMLGIEREEASKRAGKKKSTKTDEPKGPPPTLDELI